MQLLRQWILGSRLTSTLESCNNATTTLSSPADISRLAACKTFTGNIVIATDSASTSWDLTGVETVIGSVIAANNSVLDTFTSASLQTVTSNFILDTLPALTNLSFPQWGSVDTLILNNISTPKVMDLAVTLQQVNNIYLTNSKMESLSEFAITTSQIQNLEITGNFLLQNCSLGVENVTQQMTIVNNSATIDVSLPNLTNACSVSISNATGIGMPLLQTVSQDLNIGWNNIQILSLPKLQDIGGELNIESNFHMSSLSMAELVDVQGNMTIMYNQNLESLQGFPALSFVGGNMTLEGDYTRFVSILLHILNIIYAEGTTSSISLPSLHVIRGDLILESTRASDCFSIPSSAVEGKYTCTSSGNSVVPSGGSSKGASVGIAVGSLTAVVLVCIGIVWCSRMRWKLAKEQLERFEDSHPPPVPPKERERGSYMRSSYMRNSFRKSGHSYYDLKSLVIMEVDESAVSDNGTQIGGGSSRPSHSSRGEGRKLTRHELPDDWEARIQIYEMPATPGRDAQEMPVDNTLNS